VSRYIIEFKRGDATMLVMPRLRVDEATDPRDHCATVLVNEPSSNEVAFLYDRGEVCTKHVDDNEANVYMVPYDDEMDRTWGPRAPDGAGNSCEQGAHMDLNPSAYEENTAYDRSIFNL
jgi:hypothetical protein